MRGRPTVIYLDVGSVATLRIRIPIVSLGSGRPILSILCGVHGDETAGLMASYRFIKYLSTADSVRGSVRIITAANPFAQATRSRIALSDFYDLNRIGEGKPDGTLTERVAHALFEFLGDSTLVIDLHEFRMDTPIMAIYIPSERTETDRAVLESIAAFGPAVVWSMNLSRPEEVQYSGSLVAALVRSGVASFGVETSRVAVLSDETIDHVADGLYRVAQNLGIVEGKPKVSSVVAYDRKVITADVAGLWEPVRSILDQVKETDIVGRLVSLHLTSEEHVIAGAAGTILQLARHQLVDTGANLFAIGIVNEEVTEALHSVVAR